jgi:hypothetical protein
LVDGGRNPSVSGDIGAKLNERDSDAEGIEPFVREQRRRWWGRERAGRGTRIEHGRPPWVEPPEAADTKGGVSRQAAAEGSETRGGLRRPRSPVVTALAHALGRCGTAFEGMSQVGGPAAG